MESKFFGNAVFERIAHMKVGMLIDDKNGKKIVFLVNQIHRKAQKKLKKKNPEEISVLAAEVAAISAVMMAIRGQFNKALKETLNCYLKIKPEDLASEMDNEEIFVQLPNQKVSKH